VATYADRTPVYVIAVISSVSAYACERCSNVSRRNLIMPLTMSTPRDDDELIDLADDIGDLLEGLPEDTSVVSILAAFGHNIERTFNIIRSNKDKRCVFDWFVRSLHEAIGRKLPPADFFNGDPQS
jgi:hypothetical protein